MPYTRVNRNTPWRQNVLHIGKQNNAKCLTHKCTKGHSGGQMPYTCTRIRVLFHAKVIFCAVEKKNIQTNTWVEDTCPDKLYCVSYFTLPGR